MKISLGQHYRRRHYLLKICSRQGLREGSSGGTSYPNLGLGGPGLKGPGRVQVSALSFGIAPEHRNQTCLQQKYQSAYSVPVIGCYFCYTVFRASNTDPAPRGGMPGPCPPTDYLCPPQTKLCPPKRGLCPEEVNRFRALERKSRPKLVFFVDLKLEKPLKIPISAGKSLEISVKTFFFLEDTCFRPEKPLEIPISAGKSL